MRSGPPTSAPWEPILEDGLPRFAERMPLGASSASWAEAPRDRHRVIAALDDDRARTTVGVAEPWPPR